MIDSSTREANTHMYWTGFTLITCKNSIAGPIVNTQSVVVLVWIILGDSIKPGLCYDIPESLYGRTGIPYREHRTAVYRYIGISLHPYIVSEFLLYDKMLFNMFKGKILQEMGSWTEYY